MLVRPILRTRAMAWTVCCSLGCLAAGSARADVLEIGREGVAVWVVGGPPSAREVVDHGSAGHNTQPTALTSLAASAGPAFWRGHVSALATKYDISPDLLEAVVWQESRWNMDAISPAGARGLAQLMPGTSRELGVDAKNPYANLEGGARYLRAMLDRFDGNIEKALAAYNAGPRRVERARGIPEIRETKEYVASILARLAQPIRR